MRFSVTDTGYCTQPSCEAFLRLVWSQHWAFFTLHAAPRIPSYWISWNSFEYHSGICR